MRPTRVFALAVLLLLAVSGTHAAGSSTGNLPPPARAGCGEAGVGGAGFTVYSCGSGAGATKYAHPAELLVVRADDSFMGYPDAFSQTDLVRKSVARGIVASHNNGVYQVTKSALLPLISERRLQQLVPSSPHLGHITGLKVAPSGDIFLRASYYGPNRDGCENARIELTAVGRLKLLWQSATGLSCG